jgi:hypothetical protein
MAIDFMQRFGFDIETDDLSELIAAHGTFSLVNNTFDIIVIFYY